MTERRPFLTRRRFLQALAVLAVGAVTIRWGVDRDLLRYHGRRIVRPLRAYGSIALNQVWPPARRIRRHFPYLRFAPGTVERFVADYERTIGPVPAWSSDAYMRFLLSTDFFRHQADESRTLTYAAFYEPAVTACYNPLSMFASKPGATPG